MSLFDVLRYPISDIEDTVQINSVPDIIWVKWLDCVFLHTIQNGRKAVRDTVDMIHRDLAVQMIIQSHRNAIGARASAGQRELIKSQLTARLHEIIASHESHME
jgi:hypothetical protein